MRFIRMLSAIFLTLAALTAVGAGQAGAQPISEVPISIAQIGESCANIGNGDVCIRIGDRYDGNHADITVWYDKHAGAPVTIRLRYAGGGNGYDEGAFTISAGEVRGYIWRHVYLWDNCYYGQIMTGPPPNYTPIVTGGHVCI
ncbi:hypothetical protein [Saccharothrix deserti]|uniref:hypothetical protein n=1 Tax=Saccharothrix deserti TaxID=2593674 RepID=UPI00131BE526|nr:hypothetical protein [Saccharothrix deserti]